MDLPSFKGYANWRYTSDFKNTFFAITHTVSISCMPVLGGGNVRTSLWPRSRPATDPGCIVTQKVFGKFSSIIVITKR